MTETKATDPQAAPKVAPKEQSEKPAVEKSAKKPAVEKPAKKSAKKPAVEKPAKKPAVEKPAKKSATKQRVDKLSCQIGATVRALRLAASMTAATLAKRSGVTNAHISFLERGLTRFNTRMLASISKALKVPVVQLVMTTEELAMYRKGGGV